MKKILTLSWHLTLLFVLLVLTHQSEAEQAAIVAMNIQNLDSIVKQTTQDSHLELNETTKRQLAALMFEKQSRTPAQQKIDSQLLVAAKIKRHEEIAPGITTIRTTVNHDGEGRQEVDISGDVTDALLEVIRCNGGVVINSYPQFKTVRAYLPPECLEIVGALSEVRTISRATQAEVSRMEETTRSQGKSEPRGIRADRVKKPLSIALAKMMSNPAFTLVQEVTSAQQGSGGPTSAGSLSTIAVSPSPTIPIARKSGPTVTNQKSKNKVYAPPVVSNSVLPLSAQITPRVGSVTSEGDITHRANTARSSFAATGAGIKIGVISDSVKFLSQSQTNGDLPAISILSGRSGVDGQNPDTGEGTAMLEIIHDLAPGAQLYFSTGKGGPAAFAQNILDLRAAGCHIIVDDLEYPDEAPFQDAVVAQAVNSVISAGAFYFSSAGNSGNINDLSSSVWEGDFVDDGPITYDGTLLGNAHRFFAPRVIFNQAFTQTSSEKTCLFWSDRLGGSTNDYDLFIVDTSGVIVEFGNNVQNGTQDPIESATIFSGEHVLVVKFSGANRYLHVNVGRGKFSYASSGRTKGHAAAVNAFSVAAVKARTSFPDPFNGGSVNPVETFSSDGPRRVFYGSDGTAITPGNFSSSGGTVRAKPDIAAADGVTTSVPGFSTFFGTSAAAPHAAAIACLLLSFRPSLSPTQLRTALVGTALDIETPGADRDSGAGLVMAHPA